MTCKLSPSSTVYVAGHRGMVGQAVIRSMTKQGHRNFVVRSRSELDLRNQTDVNRFFADNTPDIVVLAAAKVGGIHANHSYPAEFFYDNLMMAANVIHAAHLNDVNRLLFLGSTCIYPRLAPQPMPEDCLLTSPLESTNEAYALAKISGLKLCQYYRTQYGRLFHSAMPTNLYGPGDNYHPENSHVIPALLYRFHEAKISGASEVTIWGTGQPRRDFLHVDDLALGLLFLLGMENPPDLVNVGTGKDITIIELAQAIANVVGYAGQITTDPSKPDGTPVKRTDTSRLNSSGWHPTIGLETGLQMTYQDFLQDNQQGILRNT